MTYFYARVSSKDQNIDRQLIAAKDLRLTSKNIFVDYQSGRDFDRPQCQKLLRLLRKGDLLVVQSIDRLGRNYEEIQRQWRELVFRREVEICVLDMPLLDTRKKNENDLTSKFITDLVLQILAYVAQTEREYIRKRQYEGIKAAMDRGVKFGRRRREYPPQFFEDLTEYLVHGKGKKAEICEKYHICSNTFYRYIHEIRRKILPKPDEL